MKLLNPFIIPLLLLSATSYAGALTRTGKVENVTLHDPDKLMLKLTSMN
ncbi:hypothetical protein [Pseudoalteromonas fuliginea]|nr:hypothetical protein [Pseudoalteromonas fuliginea]